MSAVLADALGAHRGVEAGVAELIARPVDPQFVGHEEAGAFDSAGGDWWSSASGGARCGGRDSCIPRYQASRGMRSVLLCMPCAAMSSARRHRKANDGSVGVAVIHLMNTASFT